MNGTRHDHDRKQGAIQESHILDPKRSARHFDYAFRCQELLKEALTPPSAGLVPHNQRLEYLGDALLHAAMGLLIFRLKPEWKEGPMSKLRGMLVNVESLKSWAEELGLELVRGPRSPSLPTALGKQKPLSDAMEALLAAVHEDACRAGEDGFAAVMNLVTRRFEAQITRAQIGIWEKADPKTTLQEWAASAGMPAPIYQLLGQSGPDHRPMFKVSVHVGHETAEASGPAVKKAQAEAAEILLQRLKM